MKKLSIVAAVLLVAAAAWLGPLVVHHYAPLAWTGEAGRLAAVIGLRPGFQVAEIGAGQGAMAREIAKAVGRDGRLYVTEMSDERRARLASIARDEALPQMVVVEALANGTNLPTACCDAIYMRNVLHHIEDWPAYAADIARTVRPGGVVAVIDFAPGALPHLTADHGASPDRVVTSFTGAGFRLESRDDDWGGKTFMLAFRRVE